MTLSRLLLVSLLAPALALAQAEPQPAAPPAPERDYSNYPIYTPPPASEQPAKAAAPAVHRRDSWYIGLGLGTGGGQATAQGTTLSFKDMNAGRTPTTAMLEFKVGATLSPTLLVGFDFTGVQSAASGNGLDTSVRISNWDAVATWFPFETGLLLRGGAGISYGVWDSSTGNAVSLRGGNVLGGIGYAFWLGQSFNLTADLDLSLQGYQSSSDALKSTAMWALWLGADWY